MTGASYTERDLFINETPDPDRFFDQDYAPTLRRIVDRVISDQGPIPLDLLARAVAREHGWKRTGKKIWDRVVSCIGNNEIHSDANGSFVWAPGAFSDEIPFRNGLIRGIRERRVEALGLMLLLRPE